VAIRVDDVDVSADGDMLLFQWGTYDRGSGSSFGYDITRQLIDENDPDDDGAIWQLSVTARYPEVLGASVGSGNRWCRSPDEVTAFEAFIEHCAATSVVEGLTPARIEVHFEQAG
jgi:hypothetical protein